MQSIYLVTVNLLIVFIVLSAQKENYLCKKFLRSPNFDVNRIVGRPWRIYYTWVLDYGDRCLDTTFKKLNRTSGIKRQFANNMDIYMKSKVVWDDATLLVSKSPAVLEEGDTTKEMLFFPKLNTPGAFEGIIDFTTNLKHYVPRHSATPMHFVLKLFLKDKYLVMTDCIMGVTVLMARPDADLYRLEIQSVAAQIWDEIGFQSCSLLKNKYEIEGVLANNSRVTD